MSTTYIIFYQPNKEVVTQNSGLGFLRNIVGDPGYLNIKMTRSSLQQSEKWKYSSVRVRALTTLGLEWCWKWLWFHQLLEAPCNTKHSVPYVHVSARVWLAAMRSRHFVLGSHVTREWQVLRCCMTWPECAVDSADIAPLFRAAQLIDRIKV